MIRLAAFLCFVAAVSCNLIRPLPDRFDPFQQHKPKGCNAVNGPYMDCIKSVLDRNYLALERNYHSDFQNIAETCILNNGCTWVKGWDADILGKDGPLAKCSICRKIAKIIKRMILKAPASQKSCFRQKFRNAIAAEMRVCINYEKRAPAQGIQFPNIPDFDEVTDRDPALPKAVFESMMDVVTVLHVTENNCTNGDAVTACINKPQNGGYYAGQCDARKYCLDETVRDSGCQNFFLRNTEQLTCECFEEKRVFLHKRLNQIADAVRRAQTSKQCTDSVLQLMISHSRVNWAKVANRAIKDCLGQFNAPGSNSTITEFRQLVKIGCNAAIQKRQSEIRKARQEGRQVDLSRVHGILDAGVRLARYFIDAMFHRVSRFCPTHCRPYTK